jgi:hypothetical protein
MLQVSYQLFGVVFLIALVGCWGGHRLRKRRRIVPNGDHPADTKNSLPSGDDIEHRVLMYLMAQKTESILAALANTIDQERQKLGGIVRNPSVDAAGSGLRIGPTQVAAKSPSGDMEIFTLARQGRDVSGIARRLELCEDEVRMVMRLKNVSPA